MRKYESYLLLKFYNSIWKYVVPYADRWMAASSTTTHTSLQNIIIPDRTFFCFFSAGKESFCSCQFPRASPPPPYPRPQSAGLALLLVSVLSISHHSHFPNIILSVTLPKSILLFDSLLKGVWHEIFYYIFFHESFSPDPLSTPWGLFRIYTKIRRYIRKLKLITSVKNSQHQMQNPLRWLSGDMNNPSM